MEIAAAIATASSVYELAKTAINARDASVAENAIAEIREKQIALQSLLLELQQKSAAHIQRIAELEKEITNFREWKRDAVT